MSLLARQVLVWTTIGILWCIITPFGIYNLYLYHKFRDKMELNKRHHSTVICLVIFILIFWSIERGLGLIWSSKIFGKSFLLTVIHYLTFSFTIYGILWSLVWRYWLVYYDIRFAISTSHSKWKQILNPKHNQTEWFIANKQTYGNQIWCCTCCIFLYLITSILSFLFHLIAVLQIYSQTVATFMDGTMNLLAFMFLCIIWKKTPKFEDKFWIRYELKIIIYAYITLYIWYFIGNLFHTLINIDEFTFNLISSWIAIITTTIFVYICTRWTLNKFVFNQGGTEWNSLSFSRSITFSLGAPNLKSPQRSVTISDTGVKLRLYELLADNQGLNFFMNHLIYEFSQECLLSFIEFVQWKTCLHYIIVDKSEIFNAEHIEHVLLIDEISKNKSHVKSRLLRQNSESVPSLNKDISVMIDDNSNLYYRSNILLFEFPDKVALSSIVANIKYNIDIDPNEKLMLKDVDKIINDFKLKAYCLFNRYIYNRNGCDLEINIDSAARHRLIRLMSDVNGWMDKPIMINELYVLFDECIEEMYKLMKDSFQRFKQTEDFLHLDQQIFSSMKSV